ncbi:TPA: hypothetical protein HA238_05140 [Candidatus Micrarchaeota archaeon]|nr:hypothetical protein [Candidatus Micrarchaeota archaeon]
MADDKFKTIMFTTLLSALIILGLSFLGVFGTTIKHAPFLFAGAMIGFAIVSYTNVKPFHALVGAIAGFIIAVTLQQGAELGVAQTPVSLFAIMIGVSPLLSFIREKIFVK